MADGTVKISSGVVKDQHIASSAAIDADKMQHVFNITTDFGLEYNATPAAKVFVLYQAQATGTLRAFNAGLYDTGTSTSVTYDLKKNGTTVLSGVITVTNSEADRSQNDGTITVASFSAGDVFTVHLAVSSSTGATGPFASAVFEENSAA